MRGLINKIKELRQPQLSDSQAWAIAAGGILPKVNGDILTSLRNRINLLELRNDILLGGWDISDYASAIDRLTGLRDGGHREDLEFLWRELSILSEREFANFLKDQPEEEHIQIQFVRDNKDRFKYGSIAAWDFVRIISLARYCYSAGFLPEQEAWTWIMSAAKVLQQRYASWEELADQYVLGRTYWAGGVADDFAIEHQNVISWLLSNPASPWKRLPWSTPLEAV